MGASKLHRYWSEFEAEEVVGFKVINPPGHPETQCFAAIFASGDERSFSYLDCISPYPYISDVTAALRTEVADEVANSRKGEVVHHDDTTFAQLRDGWLAEIGLNVDEIKVKSGRGEKYEFIDRKLADKWRAYHAAHAKLVSTSRDEHRRIHYGSK